MIQESKFNRVKTKSFLLFVVRRRFFFLSVRISYQPGKDRERPYQLELVIKTHQSILITFEYEMAFLKWNEFPPDPNHGFYIPSAIISTEFPSRLKSNFILRSLQSFSLNRRFFLLLSSSSSSSFVFDF